MQAYGTHESIENIDNKKCLKVIVLSKNNGYYTFISKVLA